MFPQGRAARSTVLDRPPASTRRSCSNAAQRPARLQAFSPFESGYRPCGSHQRHPHHCARLCAPQSSRRSPDIRPACPSRRSSPFSRRACGAARSAMFSGVPRTALRSRLNAALTATVFRKVLYFWGLAAFLWLALSVFLVIRPSSQQDWAVIMQNASPLKRVFLLPVVFVFVLPLLSARRVLKDERLTR